MTSWLISPNNRQIEMLVLKACNIVTKVFREFIPETVLDTVHAVSGINSRNTSSNGILSLYLRF